MLHKESTTNKKIWEHAKRAAPAEIGHLSSDTYFLLFKTLKSQHKGVEIII